MPEIYLIYTQNIAEIYIRDKHELYENIPEIFTRYTPDIQKISRRYPRDIPEI